MSISFRVIGEPIPQGVVPPMPTAPRQLPLQRDGDVVQALAKLQSLIGDVDPPQMWAMVVEGAPVSKSRARWDGKHGRTYTPARTVAAERVLRGHFEKTLGGKTLGGCVAIVAIFYRPNFQRIDADNLMKLVMDAATKAKVWADDCYVTAQAAFMEMDRERPRTVIALCQTESSLDRERMFSCSICGKDFKRAGTATHKNPPKFCSRECRSQGYVNDRKPARCARCDKEFMRERAGARYCSPECVAESRRNRPPNANLRPWPLCEGCGKRVSRREYIRCSDCRPKGRKPGSKNKRAADPGEQPGVYVRVEALP